jgi:hypothetical protein
MADHHPTEGTTRRGLLRAGGLGLSAAFLASCAKEITPGGISGTPASSTSTPATVPRKLPSEAALAADATQLRTAASVELLIADVYTKYGPKLTDAAFVEHAARFAEDHAAAAEAYLTGLEEAEADAGITDSEPVEPNPYLLENFVAPAEQGLVDDTSILNFLRASEATIAANAINAVGIFTTASWRQRTMSFGAAAARRITVLDNAGQGSVPTGALFPLTDLMPNDAFLTGETTTTTAAPDAAGDASTTTTTVGG